MGPNYQTEILLPLEARMGAGAEPGASPRGLRNR
jgi:hypothetical protein